MVFSAVNNVLSQKTTARYSAEINRQWGAQPQWIHLHHSSCIYGSQNIEEEGTEGGQESEHQKLSVKLSVLEMAALTQTEQ